LTLDSNNQLVELLSQVAVDESLGDLLNRAETGELNDTERLRFQARALSMFLSDDTDQAKQFDATATSPYGS
jgi:hypothetical protein